MTPGIRHVAIVVPARDEAATIPASLAAIDRARRRIGRITTTTVVVIDSCSDDTFGIVRRWCGDSTQHVELSIPTAAGNVGAARALGTRIALAATLHAPHRTWVANTDADSEVPDTWLGDQLALANVGAVAVAGLVELAPDADPRLHEAFRHGYRIDGPGKHRHVHGANLGVRGDVYQRSGGWRSLPTGEDHDLWRRLQRSGAEVVTSTSIVVRTSARTIGRAPNGFARDRHGDASRCGVIPSPAALDQPGAAAPDQQAWTVA